MSTYTTNLNIEKPSLNDAVGLYVINDNYDIIDTEVASRIKTDDIIDGLTSTDTSKPLSAKQGKVLNDTKVDKVTGKGLSTNDYTDADKTIVDSVVDALDGKVDKVTGKGLSTNDYTTSDRNKLTGISPIYYAVCRTSANIAAKTITLSHFDLQEGASINIQFANANTASNPTLNVNSTGAKPMVLPNGSAIGQKPETDAWYAGAIVNFTYDGARWVRNQGFNTNTQYDIATTSSNGLMTPADKSKLNNIEYGANKTIIDDELSDLSENPVQNNVIKAEFDSINADIANTGRIVSSLVNANNGKTFLLATDDSDAYSKVIPTDALSASPKMWGGKSIVWNQMAESTSIIRVTPVMGSASIDVSVCSIVPGHTYIVSCEFVDYSGTKALRCFSSVGRFVPRMDGNPYYTLSSDSQECIWIIKNENSTAQNLYIGLEDTTGTNLDTSDAFGLENITVVDVSRAFGVGNEPTSINDSRVNMVYEYAKTHHEYNNGEIVSANTNNIEYSNSGVTMQNIIPSAVQALDGYGISTIFGEEIVSNYVEYDASQGRWRYHKNVGSTTIEKASRVQRITTYGSNPFFAIGFLSDSSAGENAKVSVAWDFTYIGQKGFTAFGNTSVDKDFATASQCRIIVRDDQYEDATAFRGAYSDVVVYYQLEEEIVTDITDLMGTVGKDLANILVDGSGSITFKQADTVFSIPNEIEYSINDSSILVRLGEVEDDIVFLNQAIGVLPASETGSEWANKEELNTELVGQFVGEVDRMFSTGLPQESTMGRVITQLALGNGLLNDLYLGMEVS